MAAMDKPSTFLNSFLEWYKVSPSTEDPFSSGADLQSSLQCHLENSQRAWAISSQGSPLARALNNNEINSNLNNKVKPLIRLLLRVGLVAKIISQIMPNLAKVYLENTSAINVKRNFNERYN